MAKEAFDAVVYAVASGMRRSSSTLFYDEPCVVKTRKVCLDRKIHVIIYDELEDCYEYEWSENGYYVTGEWQELVYRTFEYGPCDGSCQTELSIAGEKVKIPVEVIREIPEDLKYWRKAQHYYKRRRW